METKRDYYEVLGVEHDADARQIKRAFLKKARTLHPDVSDDPDAEEKFKEVNEAYTVLSDDTKRSNYDRFGNPDGPSGFGGGDYVDMSDIFGGFGMNDIFDSFFGGQGGHGQTARTRGRDMGISLRISLAEAASGCTKTVAYDRLAPCDDCGGTGVAEGGSIKSCPRCHGTGRVVTVQRTILGQMQTQTACPDCGGTGHVIDHPCETCSGQGRTPSREKVDIDIPAGIYSGQDLKVEGFGEAGVRGDRSGDLVVRIEVTDDERFRRQGDDLFCVVDVTALEAMLGCVVEVEGIMDGESIELEIPAGCQNGQQILSGAHGMPRRGTSARGNLVAVVSVSVPDDLTPEQTKLIRQVASQRGERVSTPESNPLPPRRGRAASRKPSKRPHKD
ncbi:MAG: molecular chaperone DnaJ [Atopobiaceae bacterium]|nr:molecular chaperone DnaJ [Atopobiaceae bacterium]MCI2173256.1 molecular chaperone DnaJ [Atopobiaceae bacterium]MCI2207251.1 molecular chaperone DnaJ [Atopobiaceae bacterium]